LNKRDGLSEVDLAAIATLAEDDPARDLIAEILSIVHVSHWSFARFSSSGSPDQLFLPPDANNRRHEFEHLSIAEEFAPQRLWHQGSK